MLSLRFCVLRPTYHNHYFWRMVKLLNNITTNVWTTIYVGAIYVGAIYVGAIYVGAIYVGAIYVGAMSHENYFMQKF